jgi:hypothetical protein
MKINGQIHVPADLPLGKGHPYLLSGKISAPQRLSGHFGEEKILLLLPAIESREVYQQPL